MFATLLGRLINFIITIAIVRILSPYDYGNIAYAASINVLIMPLMGRGLLPSLLRYGALRDGQFEKKYFVRYILKVGLSISLGIMAIVWLFIPFLTQKLPESGIYLAIYIIQIIGLLFFKAISNYCMLIHRNQIYAQAEIVLSLLWLVFNILAGIFIGPIGYVASLVILPFIVGGYYWTKLRLSDKKAGFKIKVNVKELLDYGFFTSLGAVLSGFLYAIDVMLIGNLLESPTLIAQYRTASIIPLNVIILSNATMSANAVKIARSAVHEPLFLLNFYKNYLKAFIPACILIYLFFYFSADYIMFLFGEEYLDNVDLVPIFAWGAIGGILVRVPLGNMLPTMGFPRLNAFFSIVVLAINFTGSYWAIQHYGIKGAAMVTSAMFWLSGGLSLVVFIWWIRKQKVTSE